MYDFTFASSCSGPLCFNFLRSAIREVVFPAQAGDVICPGCNGKIFDAEKLLTQYGPFHTNCFKCFKCEKSLVSSPAFKIEEGEGLTITCKQCSQGEQVKTCEVIAKGMFLHISFWSQCFFTGLNV